MMVNARMYFFADKYDVGLLKDLAEMRFQEALKGRWRFDSFTTIVEVVDDNTLPSNGLRASLISVIKQHRRDLRDSVAFTKLVQCDGDSAVDVIDAWTNKEAPASQVMRY